MDFAIQHDGWRTGTEAKTVDRLKRDAAVECRLMKIDAEQGFDTLGQCIAAHRLASLGATEFQHVPAGGMIAVIMIEGYNAVDLGAGKVELLGDNRQGFLRHVSELLLDLMQNRKEWSFEGSKIVNDRADTSGDIAVSDTYVHQQLSLTTCEFLENRKTPDVIANSVELSQGSWSQSIKQSR